MPVLFRVKAGEVSADDLFLIITLDAPRTGIPAHDRALGIEHEYGVICDAGDEQFETPFALLQALDRLLQRTGALVHLSFERLIDPLQRLLRLRVGRNVAGDGELTHAAVAQFDRDGMRFHVTARAAQADDVEPPGERLAPAYPIMMFLPKIPVLRRNEITRIKAIDAVPGRGLYHLHTGGIHLRQPAVRRH